MLKKLISVSGAILLVLFLFGCQEQFSTDPVEENSSKLNLNKRVLENVTGSGHFTTAAGDLRTFSFTARKYADGSFSGRWVRVNHLDENGHSQGVVTCFTIVGDQVWLGGYATQGLFSDPPNNEVAWRVVDNGQGNNNPPDQISLQFVNAGPGFADNYCATTPESPTPLHDVEAGNIQIH